MVIRSITIAILLGTLLAGTASAEVRRIVERAEFVRLIDNQTLMRLGIKLQVGADGAIRGKAFGKPVTGQWQWQDGFFCRDLFWGERDLGPNCQAVSLRGDVVRFTSDRGQGQFADLTIR